jgi:hypothetical protein
MDRTPDSKERKMLIGLLRGIPFEHLSFSDYFEKTSSKKHGVTKEDIKKIYSQFEKIREVTVRSSRDGDKYCFLYKINKNLSWYLIFRLDKKPKELFNAYSYPGDIERRIGKKYFGPLFKPK